jgi:hypothetical protein
VLWITLLYARMKGKVSKPVSLLSTTIIPDGLHVRAVLPRATTLCPCSPAAGGRSQLRPARKVREVTASQTKHSVVRLDQTRLRNNPMLLVRRILAGDMRQEFIGLPKTIGEKGAVTFASPPSCFPGAQESLHSRETLRLVAAEITRRAWFAEAESLHFPAASTPAPDLLISQCGM